MSKSIKKVSVLAATTAMATAAVLVAMALVIAPLMTSSAMAARSSTECVHNGNGRISSGPCSNPSGTTVICTTHGHTTTCESQ